MRTLAMRRPIVLSLLALFLDQVCVNAAETPVIIRDAPGWPVVFELACGDEIEIERTLNGKLVKRGLRLVSIEESWEPDLWNPTDSAQRTLREAKVVVEVDGLRRTLLARPYQLPTVVNGLRVHVEATRNWAQRADVAPLGWRGGDVRFSAVAEGESWGPQTLRFPIGDFRWRSSSYNNTWLSLVPNNQLYYHRGEDLGAIPNRLPVIAMLDGAVSASPLPEGDGDSNDLIIDHGSGLKVDFAHMDIETIDPRLTPTAVVKAGDVLAKTGMTWAGRKSQTHDHHLHTELILGDTNISSYPFLVEAYLRDYADGVLAVAGGYAYGVPGQTIRVDGSRSIAREGHTISSYSWQLHDGRTVNGAAAEVGYDRPGLYSETLVVRTDQGGEDHDYLQVRIYDPEHPREGVWGWFYHLPVRGLVPGSEVTFENRLFNAASDVVIDFGDGTERQPIEQILHHAYERPGIYDASLHATNAHGEPAVVRMRVVVGD